MSLEWVKPVLVAALCGMDATAALQLALARPLLAGTLSGAWLGQPAVGLCAGSLVELLGLGLMPVGSSVPPDLTLAAVLTTALAIWAHQALPDLPWEACLSAALFVAILPAWLGSLGEVAQRHWHARLARCAEAAAARNESGALGRAVVLSLLVTWLRVFFTAAFFIWLLPGSLIFCLSRLPLPVVQALAGGFWSAFLLGLAVVLDQLWERRSLPALVMSFLAASFCLYGLKLAAPQVLLLACLCGAALVLAGRWDSPGRRRSA